MFTFMRQAAQVCMDGYMDTLVTALQTRFILKSHKIYKKIYTWIYECMMMEMCVATFGQHAIIVKNIANAVMMTNMNSWASMCLFDPVLRRLFKDVFSFEIALIYLY